MLKLFCLFLILLPSILADIERGRSTCDTCDYNNKKPVVTGFSVFKSNPIDHDAFKQDLVNIVPLSRAEPGVVSYHMYENPREKGAIGFVESWEADAIDAHVKGDNVKSIFGHQYYTELRTESHLYGPWIEVTPPKDTDPIDMTFYWVVDCPKKTRLEYNHKS
jgi:quinol monooxygenase YgiN